MIFYPISNYTFEILGSTVEYLLSSINIEVKFEDSDVSYFFSL
jgi:hypothetical protein